MWKHFRRLFSIIILCVLLFLCNVCNGYYLIEPDKGETAITRISKGWRATLGAVPYQVSLKKRKNNGPYKNYCGAVIISKSKLLSAGQCVVDERCCDCFYAQAPNLLPMASTMAVAGSLRNADYPPKVESLTTSQWRRIHSVRVPFGYTSSSAIRGADIAVLFLETPYDFNSSFVKSIPIASRHIDYRGKCLISGFGREAPFGYQSPVLLLGHVNILDARTCSDWNKKNMDKFICSDQRLSQVYKGDSGGPVVCLGTHDPNDKTNTGLLVGIISGTFSTRSRPKSYYYSYSGSVYTRVSSYYVYIEHSRAACCSNLNVILLIICIAISLIDKIII